MSRVQPPTAQNPGRPDPPGRPHLLVRWTRRLALAATAVCAAVGALTIIGFWWFVWSVPTDEVALDRNADGIVVLTGGSSRIADAIELLSAGRGRRLLITGVHRATTGREIARLLPANAWMMACCVDLDYSAVNTVGNAVETRRWAGRRGIRSLIVVTSNYHMPRAMAELSRQLPDVALIPFPVISEHVRADRWWTSPPTARLLLSEYLKYIAAQLRMRIEPSIAGTELAGGRRVAKG
jgi:uncharacterized SAM-binding protein YcdF (DUF218 family)